jgi:hypothetical protein
MTFLQRVPERKPEFTVNLKYWFHYLAHKNSGVPKNLNETL